jgi:two-component system sensor histidine kinase/response regulator
MINESQTPFSGMRILLAEDNGINREVIGALLNRSGFDVDTANNGLQALEMVAGHAYDMVLMDIQMPCMDGLEATRAIRAMTGNTFDNENVPILALTATTSKADIQTCFEAGINDIITKPVEPEGFLSLIGKWLNKQQTSALKESPPSLAASAGVGSTDDEVIFARLEQTEGIEARAGLHNLQADVGDYLSLLREFDQEVENDMGAFDQLITRGEMEKACSVTHNFKGVAGTLGLVGLYTCTLALERVLRDRIDGIGSPADKELDALAQSFKTQVKTFQDVLRGIDDLDG